MQQSLIEVASYKVSLILLESKRSTLFIYFNKFHRSIIANKAIGCVYTYTFHIKLNIGLVILHAEYKFMKDKYEYFSIDKYTI